MAKIRSEAARESRTAPRPTVSFFASRQSIIVPPMNLHVLPTVDATQPWYADGLRFTCSQCGNCCTGGPGYVWISREEIVRLGEHLKLTAEQVVEEYCRKV